MIDPPVESRPLINPSRVLFTLAAVAMAASLLIEWAPMMPGWTILGLAGCYLVQELWSAATGHPIYRHPVPELLVTLANASLLATAYVGWRTGGRHSTPMLLLAVYGLGSAFFAFAIRDPSGRPLIAWQTYATIPVGGWLWIAGFALVTAGWACVVWNQRQMRNAAISSMTTTTPPQSGKSRADDKHGG